MKNIRMYLVLVLILALSLGVAYANDWVFVGEYDFTGPLATDATNLQKEESFNKKFQANPNGVTPVWIIPTVPQQKDGTITHINAPSGTTKNPALVDFYSWTPDTHNATESSGGIDLTQQKNWTGGVTASGTYPVTGKIFYIGTPDAPQYDFIGISHPSLSGVGSAIGKIHVYAGRS